MTSSRETDTRSWTVLPKGTRVRTLAFRRRPVTVQGPDAWKEYVDVPVGTEGVVVSCSNAGFRGQVHMIRTTEGHLVSEFAAPQLEVI